MKSIAAGVLLLATIIAPHALDDGGSPEWLTVVLSREGADECLPCVPSLGGTTIDNGGCPPPNLLSQCASWFGLTIEASSGMCELWPVCPTRPCQFGMQVWGAADPAYCCCAEPPTVNGVGTLSTWTSPSGMVYVKTPVGTAFDSTPQLLGSATEVSCTWDVTLSGLMAVVMRCPGVVGSPPASVSVDCLCKDC